MLDVLLEQVIMHIGSTAHFWSHHDFLGTNFLGKFVSISISFHLPVFYIIF